MTLTVKQVSSIYAQIVNGVPKEKSHHVTDEESAAMWDKIAAEVEQMKAGNPNVVFSIPNEMPDADDEDTDAEPPEPPAETDTSGEPPPQDTPAQTTPPVSDKDEE